MTPNTPDTPAKLAEFNRYFTSANSVDVGARVSVPTAEWRDLHARLLAHIDAQALPAAEPEDPAGFIAFGEHNGETIPLGYWSETENGVKYLILTAAIKAGYKGTITGRLQELGWWIGPVFAAQQAAQATAGKDQV